LPINPKLDLAVVLSGRVQFDHHLVAVPAVTRRLRFRHRLEVRVLGGVGQPLTAIAKRSRTRHHRAVLIPVVAVIVALPRPIGVDVMVTRLHFSGQTRALNVVLDDEQEKASAIRWWCAARPRVLAAQAHAVMAGAGDAEAGVKLGVGTDKNRVEIWDDSLIERVGHLCRADLQLHFQGFRPGVDVVSDDTKVGSFPSARPLTG
jgi:hypothetical protein